MRFQRRRFFYVPGSQISKFFPQKIHKNHPTGTIVSNLDVHHQGNISARYRKNRACGFREEDFFMYRVAKFLSFSPPKSTKIIFFPPKAYFRALAMWSTFCENLVMIAAAIAEKCTGRPPARPPAKATTIPFRP